MFVVLCSVIFLLIVNNPPETLSGKNKTSGNEEVNATTPIANGH
jgi:hypothetical protein